VEGRAARALSRHPARVVQDRDSEPARLYFRFANFFLEPIWNRDHLASVQIALAEGFGISQRGAFSESAGALRDVIENHLFQIVAPLAMEPPAYRGFAAVHGETAGVFHAMRQSRRDDRGAGVQRQCDRRPRAAAGKGRSARRPRRCIEPVRDAADAAIGRTTDAGDPQAVPRSRRRAGLLSARGATNRGHADALARTPNLDRYDLAEGQAGWPMVKDSLGNALIRPLVVMDEGHRAISEIAFQTLYGFNPCFVLELSATPKDVVATRTQSARPANVVVEVLGTELDREGMIKMPLNLDARQSSDWRDTLRAALERLNELERQARTFQADKGRYIRPIMLVKVERTGADQRDAGHIHARDVKEWLTTAASLGDAEIAIKTAETNDLNSPENQDLLAETNRVRVIVTKQALQEGWDCPFAYVLCEPIGSDATGGPHPASAACRAYWCRSTRRVLCGDSSRRDGRCCRGGEGWPGRGRPWRPGARDQGARCRHRW
jgi:hypothetical protein